MLTPFLSHFSLKRKQCLKYYPILILLTHFKRISFLFQKAPRKKNKNRRMNETCASSQNAAYPKQAMPPPNQQGYQWPAGGGEAHVPPSYPSGYSSPFTHQQQYVSLTYGKIEKKNEKKIFFFNHCQRKQPLFRTHPSHND